MSPRWITKSGAPAIDLPDHVAASLDIDQDRVGIISADRLGLLLRDVGIGDDRKGEKTPAIRKWFMHDSTLPGEHLTGTNANRDPDRIRRPG